MKKTEIKCNEDELLIAKYSKALAHPTRISILKFLVSQNACYCGDIVKELPIAQSTVSQHLKELLDAGLIHGDIEPPKVRYCINIKNWNQAEKLFKKFFLKYECCCK
ncbi:MAG: winged helix-turn-helix domain-containing protein [Bacteroidota bacterium]